MWNGASWQRALLAGSLSLAAACAHSPVRLEKSVRQFDTALSLNGHPLTLHLTSGVANPSGLLLVYATGDGGWRGKDRDVYRHIEDWGYTAVGFSAPDYLGHLPGEAGTTTPARLGTDYRHIIDMARQQLRVVDAVPVVLVGVSRGADLAIVAAGAPSVREELAGVVAMGLTREEEYVHRRRREGEAIELYARLPRLGSLPVSVIQSTRDNYVPAAEARVLFGPDTPTRQFHAVAARNHSFSGARDELYAALHASLAWIDECRATAALAETRP